MFRCRICHTLISGYPCPLCKAKPMPKKQLMKYNPLPPQFPTGKHKFTMYCPTCDMSIVRRHPLERCPYCGGRVHLG